MDLRPMQSILRCAIATVLHLSQMPSMVLLPTRGQVMLEHGWRYWPMKPQCLQTCATAIGGLCPAACTWRRELSARSPKRARGMMGNAFHGRRFRLRTMTSMNLQTNSCTKTCSTHRRRRRRSKRSSPSSAPPKRRKTAISPKNSVRPAQRWDMAILFRYTHTHTRTQCRFPQEFDAHRRRLCQGAVFWQS